MTTSYAAQIQSLKVSFTFEVAAKVAEYAIGIVRRTTEEWYTASDFQYAHPRLQADGSYHMNVWHEMTGHTIRLRVAFTAAGIEVRAESTRHEKVIFERTLSEDSTSECTGLAIGAQFERAVTGRIQYSRDEIVYG
jgi:hypothetical protein